MKRAIALAAFVAGSALAQQPAQQSNAEDQQLSQRIQQAVKAGQEKMPGDLFNLQAAFNEVVAALKEARAKAAACVAPTKDEKSK